MPGPVRRYYPAFPEDLVQEAQRVARCKTASHQLVQRSQLVLLLDRDPRLDDAEAGRGVGLSSSPAVADTLGYRRVFAGERVGPGPQGRVFPRWITPW